MTDSSWSVGHRTDRAIPDDPVGVDDPRLRDQRDAEGRRDRAVVVVDDRPIPALVGEELSATPSRVVAEHDGDQLCAMVTEWPLGVVEPDQLGVLQTHGTHSGSKKLTTTQLPLRRARSNVVPSPNSPTASGRVG